MLYPVRFEVEETPMGTGMSPSVLCHNEIQAPNSYAFFCPNCGRVWAKADAGNGQASTWVVQTHPCDLEPTTNYFQVPGSIWLPLRPEYIQSLSRQVLEREFQLHLNHYDRYHP